MATLALTNDELFAELGRLLGVSRDNADWDTTMAADIDRIVRSGRRRFFSAHNWKFLHEPLDIVIAAPITTGTVTIVDGVCAFTSAIVPTDGDNYVLEPEGGGVYSIATYTDASNCTLEDTTVDADALSTFKIHQIRYDLPAAFGGWEGPLSLENYNGTLLNESRNFPEYALRAFANRQTSRSGKPELFTVTSTTDSETAIATYQLQIYPLADKLYVVNTRYRINAGDTLDGLDTAVSADPVFTEAYKESVLAAAEVIAFGQPSSHSARYQELIREAIRQDNAIRGVRHGRPRKNTQGRSRYYDLIVGTVDMSGQEP